MKKKKFTKIRENITEVEYQKLLIYLNGKEDLTTNTKNNCKNRSKPDTNVGVRPDAKTEFNRTVKRS